jgi:hypothetical protein
MSVGVMKDSKLKLRDLHDSDTLCWVGGLEHLKIETRFINKRFPSVMGECEIVTIKVCRLYSNECLWNVRIKTKSEKSTRLTLYTGFLGELEHLKMKTRSIDEMFPSVMGEYVFLK